MFNNIFTLSKQHTIYFSHQIVKLITDLTHWNNYSKPMPQQILIMINRLIKCPRINHPFTPWLSLFRKTFGFCVVSEANRPLGFNETEVTLHSYRCNVTYFNYGFLDGLEFV